MRISTSLVVLSLAVLLAWGGLCATLVPAAEPGVVLVSDNAADDVAVQEPGQPPAALEGQPALDEKRPTWLGECCGRVCDECRCRVPWSFTADVVGLQRSTTRSQTLFHNPNTTDDLLNSNNNLNFPAAMGLQVGAVRHGPCGWDVEFGYFQVDGWIATGAVAGNSAMVTDSVGSNIDATDSVVRYASALRLAEVNLRHEWLDGLTLLAGFRAGELDETYSADALGTYSLTYVGMIAKTYNHLYGFQLGADWEFYNMGGPLRVSATCKSGAYLNNAFQSIRRFDATSDVLLGAQRDQAAFMGEAGLVATYELTKHLSFRWSAQAVWLEGVALAPEQIGATSFRTGASIDTHGGIFYYGGGAGVELKF
jgi:hypothetical protein